MTDLRARAYGPIRPGGGGNPLGVHGRALLARVAALLGPSSACWTRRSCARSRTLDERGAGDRRRPGARWRRSCADLRRGEDRRRGRVCHHRRDHERLEYRRLVPRHQRPPASCRGGLGPRPGPRGSTSPALQEAGRSGQATTSIDVRLPEVPGGGRGRRRGFTDLQTDQNVPFNLVLRQRGPSFRASSPRLAGGSSRSGTRSASGRWETDVVPLSWDRAIRHRRRDLGCTRATSWNCSVHAGALPRRPPCRSRSRPPVVRARRRAEHRAAGRIHVPVPLRLLLDACSGRIRWV